MAALNQLRRAINRFALADRNYAFLFGPEVAGEVVSLDCETTGFDPWVDEIVSIAAIRVARGRIHTSSAFRALVRPESAIRPASIKIHRLREQDVADAQSMQDVLPALLNFIGSRPLVGYWIEFDIRMLDKYLLSMLNIRVPNRSIDVSRLYYDRKYAKATPGTQIDLRYASILADLGLPSRPQHDAFEDALGAAEMYLLLDDMRQRGSTLGRSSNRIQGQFALA